MARSGRDIENLAGAGMAALLILGRLLPALTERGILTSSGLAEMLDQILLDLETAQKDARPASANEAARLHIEGMLTRLGQAPGPTNP